MEIAIAEHGGSASSGARTLARDVGILIQRVSERCRRVRCIDYQQTDPLALATEKEAVVEGLAECSMVEEGVVYERSCHQRFLVARNRMEVLEAFSEKKKPPGIQGGMSALP